MSTQLQLRRGTTTEHNTFTGAVGEVTVDTTKDTVVVHDGATAGGHPLAQEDLSNVPASAAPTFNGTNLTNVDSLPSQSGNSGKFLTTNGSSASWASSGFASGTKMLFNQTSAPTGWTKSTAQNDKALRVVSGSVGTGGTHGLSSPPSTSHTHTGPSHTHSTPSHSHSHSLSAGSHTLSTSQMPSHTHSVPLVTEYNGSNPGPPRRSANISTTPVDTGSTGGGGSHSHSLSGSITSGGSGTSGSGGTGNTSSDGPTAFAPAYVDVIIATKD